MTELPVPGNFLTASAAQRLELVLEMWIRLQLSDPDLRRFTHARAEFDWLAGGAVSVRWSMLIADDHTIKAEKMVDLGPSGAMAVNGMIEPWARGVDGRISHGRLTFDFVRHSVGLDLFDCENTTVFAHHLVKKVLH